MKSRSLALQNLLQRLVEGAITVEEAAVSLESSTFVDLEQVTVDVGRTARTGAPEVVFGEGKDVEQLAVIARHSHSTREPVHFTRMDAPRAEAVLEILPDAEHGARSKTVTWWADGQRPASVHDEADGPCDVLIVSAGASDASVVEEAAATVRFLGVSPVVVQDCGVAGLHRLLSRLGLLRSARVIIAVAGMDGVLPTVVAGLVRAPVIAVPTSVGYGPGAGGLTPLLCMLSSCAPGIVVVNVDNGVGAAFAAGRMLGLLHEQEARPCA